MTAEKDFNGPEYVDPERKNEKKEPLKWRFRCRYCYYFSYEYASNERLSFGSCENPKSDHCGHMLEEDHLACQEFMFGTFPWNDE